MGRLIYSTIASLDGYMTDKEGNFDWAEPDSEVHAYLNDLERPIGTYLYGRRTYDVMTCWETDPSLAEQGSVMRDYAELWQAADKVVYSTTLEAPVTTRTRLERSFEPEAVRRLKTSTERDLSVGGADLAKQAVRAGLVDEYHLYLVPILVGGGTTIFPEDVRVPLTLREERRFAGGMVHLRYAAGS
ncbi:dihydrofolate reductase family protein [Streptomyces oceani]|uniref:Deaminase n=1 Tax=Streptomyces oceani TaxID=1075402 RepID=A0A1E7KGF5_9ACTN|nr:dihydrofolate reductase family protein [Streptomyces oceani]OEV02998.1 deaminase [Streptomyces oceani]